LFDTAEFYDYGQSEVQLGVSLKSLGVQRKDYVVITKLLKGGFGPNDMGLSRKHIIEGMKNSLKRLNMDYVDIVLASRPDPTTPLEETVRAFSWLVDNGLTLHWGTSEWNAEMIEQATQIADRFHLHAPVMD
jgi:aryl-alcohol dehydrogenase-like predicted oxidoreductase